MSCIPIQDFSLITLCDATKAGKLYSIVPSNGDGDFDVTRASTATYLGSDGLLKTAANDEPRIEFNPDGSYKGLLVEPSATNLVLRSEEFDNAYWSKNRVDINTNSIIAPDGTLTGDTITCNENAIGSAVGFGRDSLSATSASLSIFVKKGNRRYIRLISAVTTGGTTFDLDLGVVESLDTVRHNSAKIIQYPNGWYRIIVNTNNDASNTSFRVRFVDDTLTFGGNIGDFHYIWGAQVETGSVATSYIPTVASTVTRAADVISQDLSGVLPSTYSLILKVNANGGRLRMDDGTTGFDIDLTGTGQIVANVEANTITFNFPDNGQPLTELVFEKYTDFNDLEFIQKIAGLHVEVIAMTNSLLSASEINDKVFGSVSTSFIETDWGAATSFASEFRDNGYEYFPLIDTSSGTTFASAWLGNNLTSFPLIDTSSGTDFAGSWLSNNLTSFPLINTSLGTGFFRAWENNNLTSFPLIDTSSGTDFRRTWLLNNLTTWPANMFDNCPATDFTRAWENNALDATGVNNILISINKARVDGVSSGTGTIGLNLGTNAAPTGAGLTAKNDLIAAGWTVNTN